VAPRPKPKAKAKAKTAKQQKKRGGSRSDHHEGKAGAAKDNAAAVAHDEKKEHVLQRLKAARPKQKNERGKHFAQLADSIQNSVKSNKKMMKQSLETDTQIAQSLQLTANAFSTYSNSVVQKTNLELEILGYQRQSAEADARLKMAQALKAEAEANLVRLQVQQQAPAR
jgi:hypothetical protein